jgi:pyrroloquinoline quinone biosynthesis protein D
MNLDSVLKVHPETGVQRVGGRMLAASADNYLHTFEDDSGQVSEVAERIVELCDGQRSLSQVVDALCDEFEVERDVCAQDTLQFATLLVSRNILVFC